MAAADFIFICPHGEDAGAKASPPFVDAATPGLEIAERIEVMAPHPLARLAFNDCRFRAQRLGDPGHGFKIAMSSSSLSVLSGGGSSCLRRHALHEAYRVPHPAACRPSARDFQ